MRRFALVLALALSTAAVTVGTAGSAASKASFQIFVDETTSASATGLTLVSELEGSGSFSVVDKTASGEGTYEVMAGSTEIDHGTFALTRLIAFQFYGCGEVTVDGTRIPLPPDFCGGRALFAIHYTSAAGGGEGDALYEVNCQIHAPGGQAPPGTSEGVKANAKGVNFNKHVTGDNLIMMLP
jgi:hypothetical protein